MSLFKDPKGEEEICKILKALVEEYGPEHIIVKVPTCWQNTTDQNALGKVRLEFVTTNTIEVVVNCGLINITKAMELQLV